MNKADMAARAILGGAGILLLGGLTTFLPSLIIWWVWSTEIAGVLWVRAPTFEWWSVFKIMWFVTVVTATLGIRK